MDALDKDGPSRGLRSRVLFLSHDMLWPSLGGGRIRCIKLVSHALEFVRLDLIVVAPKVDVMRDSWAIPDLPGLTTHVFVDQSNSQIVPARLATDATELARRMSDAGDGYDVVHIEGHYLWPVVPGELNRRTVVVEQNIESTLLEQRRLLGDPVSSGEVEGLRARERRIWRQAGAIINLTPEDAAFVRSTEPDLVPYLVPNGWNHLPARESPRPDDNHQLTCPRLLFFADYDYAANRDALQWLITEVFPRIRREIPRAELVIGGINVPPDLLRAVKACPGAKIRGYIEDLANELDLADIVLCPLRWGGGVKVKIIESLRRACLVVSTTIGGQGIPEPLRAAMCLADGAESIAAHVVRLSGDSGERRWRRAQLVANRHLMPTWEESSQRTMRIWSALSRREDQRTCEDGYRRFS